MKIDELEKYLTEGLTEEEAGPLKAALKNQKVQARAEALRQQRELDAIEATRATLQAKLDGTDGKPGAAAIEDWYRKNEGNINAVNAQIKAFDEKYGEGAFMRGAFSQDPNPNPNPAPAGKTYSEEDIQRMFDDRFQKNIAPKVAGVIKSTGRLVQKHMLAGRKTEIDMEAIETIMAAQPGLSIEKAYEEWDKPEREKEAKANTDKEIERRVSEELQKRGASSSFPAGADHTPGTLAQRTSSDQISSADLRADLLKTWNSAGQGKQ